MTEITVGIPAYNNSATLRRAVESLLAQTVPPVLIEISDDASTDGTAEVGRALAQKHSSVRYTRQATNLGPTGNFAFLLNRARTDYFMWLAADDHVLPTYLEKTSTCLDNKPEVVTCVSQVLFMTEHGLTGATGSQPLCGTVRLNLVRYLNGPGANARLYGLHRIEAVRRAMPSKHIHAWDWAFMAGTLLVGQHEEITEALMVRELTPPEAYVRQVRGDNPGSFDRIFPLAPMTRDLLFRQRIPIDLNIIRALLKINLEHHCYYVAAHHPIYDRLIARHLRKSLWRISSDRHLHRLART